MRILWHPLDRMRGTDDRALAVLTGAGQETVGPPGSFLAGETQQSPVWGTSERAGRLPTKPGMAASAWPQVLDILPGLPREVLSLVQLSERSLSSCPQLRRGGEMETWPAVAGSLSRGERCPFHFSRYCAAPPVTGSPLSFNSPSCPRGASRRSLRTARVFLRQHWLGTAPGGVCSRVSAPVSHDSMFTRLSGLCVGAEAPSHGWLFVTPRTEACQAPLAVGLSRQEHQTELPFPLLGDLPDPRTELESPLSPVGRQILYRWATRKPISPILTAIFSSLSSTLFWTQEELLLLQSV